MYVNIAYHDGKGVNSKIEFISLINTHLTSSI